ncbi:hypothetical protein H3146_16640 [Streptomyces sp. OF3]|uniref:Uncharacterized protein n=1 Tax=Streptomyces alkaliterrae TaxID=2213162 RepID=A0A7W3ZP00_9ACTN|nr:hypothetical protein [Streptomyces alkaliterrae]MBB1254967.1 hypothetical protein [Streptomyces alkaliterrae]
MSRGKSGRFIAAAVIGVVLGGGALVGPATAVPAGVGQGGETVTAQLSCPYVVVVERAYTYPTAYSGIRNGSLGKGRQFRADPGSLTNRRLRMWDGNWVRADQVRQNGQCAA